MGLPALHSRIINCQDNGLQGQIKANLKNIACQLVVVQNEIHLQNILFKMGTLSGLFRYKAWMQWFKSVDTEV